MDYFECIVKVLLEREGCWVQQSFKVNLTKSEKRSIGKPSIPRPEIDLLAYRPTENTVLAIEAKSYLDSPGVKLAALEREFDEPQGRYKLFTCTSYRKTVVSRLKKDLIDQKMVERGVRVKLGLFAGNVYQNKGHEIRELLNRKGWFFWSPDDIRDQVEQLASEP